MSHPQIYIRSGVSNWWKVAYLLPLIIAVGILVTHFSFYGKFLADCGNPCSPITDETFSDVDPVDQTTTATYVARASWTVINGVQLLACIAGIVTAIVVINSALSDEYADKKTRRLIILIVVVAAADVALCSTLWAAIMDPHSPAQTLLRATVGQDMGSINKQQRYGDAWSLTATLCLADE